MESECPDETAHGHGVNPHILRMFERTFSLGQAHLTFSTVDKINGICLIFSQVISLEISLQTVSN